jgi:hypothetical protein
MITLKERFEKILKGFGGCSFDEPPVDMEIEFRKAVFACLEDICKIDGQYRDSSEILTEFNKELKFDRKEKK